MRIALLLLAAGLCALAGFMAAESLRQRASVLSSLAESLARLKIEIGFSATPLHSAVRRIAYGDVQEFWEAFSNSLQSGSDASEAWEEARANGYADWGERTQSIFATFVAGLGKSDRQSQCARIDDVLMLLRREIRDAEEKAKNSGKMRISLGVMSGIALIIVLI